LAGVELPWYVPASDGVGGLIAGWRQGTIGLSKGRLSMTDLHAALSHIPAQPGVYRFVDAEGAVLYVGKAKDLHKRVASYLRSGGPADGRIAEMVARARDIEWVVTGTEQEALLVEDAFIKESRPPYNVRLRDDKSYPFIEVTLRDEWPRVRFMRGRRVPGNLYFGPYASARKVREVLDLIGRIFPYRKCRGPRPGRPSGTPCLQHFIKRSLGPCEGRCSQAEYREVIEEVIGFLRGDMRAVERRIEAEMAAAAGAREFEKAALLRDRLAAVRHVAERQVARTEGAGDFDVIGLCQAGLGANVQVFRVREGALVARQQFYLENAEGAERVTVLEQFLMEFYWEGAGIPPQVIVDADGDVSGAAVLLTERRGAKVAVRRAQRGPKRRLVELAARNAKLAAEAEVERLARRREGRREAMERLRDSLGLPGLPLRIECYDISNLGDTNAVGSMVVFEEGRPRPAHYRSFAIRDVTGQDDFAMMRQVIERRFARGDGGGEATGMIGQAAKGFDESFATHPDLVVVDGGKGQLSAALAGLAAAGADDVAVVSLAKQREEVFVPGRVGPLPLPPDDPGSLLLQRVRDEAHRFALTHHRRRRAAQSRRSAIFDELPGVGSARRRKILEYFGSPERFLTASREELEAVPGLPPKVARGIYAHLHKTG